MAGEDFDIDSLAVYLHLLPQQVSKLADRGELPGRKVAGDWRFSEAEIHQWMESRMGLLGEAELAQVEDAMERRAEAAGETTLSIAQMLHESAIATPLEARSRGKVITAMCDLAANTGLLWDAKRMAEAVRAREDMQPTAMDNGVALLHPRRPMPGILGEPLLAVGISPGGIPFGGAGGVLTDIFILLASTDDRSHLRVLARLARMISDEAFLASLRSAGSPGMIHDLFITQEQSLPE